MILVELSWLGGVRVVAQYTIKAWSNEGPLRLSEPLTLKAALSKAHELRVQGFTHISLIDPATGLETELKDLTTREDSSE